MSASPYKMEKRLFIPGFIRLFPLLLVALAAVSFGAPQTNSIPWSDNFENYTNGTPLIDGTNGWYSSFSGTNNDCAIIQQTVKYSGTQAAMIPVDVTLSNRFSNITSRIVGLEMYVQPQLYNGTNYPSVSTNVAAQFYVNSNGYFVVCNGTNWRTATTLASGGNAVPITNTSFTRVQVNLRYKNHTWNLKAWTTNDTPTLVASTYYVNFTSNLDTFNGFDIYNGNATSYVDDVQVTNINLVNKVNGVRLDAVRYINGAQPGSVNGVTE